MSAKSIAQLCAAKLQLFFELSKKNVLFCIFFSYKKQGKLLQPVR